MIEISKVLRKLLELNDNDSCLCLSGKQYKDCHKLKLANSKDNPKKLFLEIIRIRKKKECLYGNGSNCRGAIIKAHSVSKKYLRNITDSSNHVYSFIKCLDVVTLDSLYDFHILPYPEKIGINDVTTFYGLCSKHDDELFSCFEKNVFDCKEEQIKALHLRSVIKEIHVKTEAILATENAQKSILKVSEGFNAVDKNVNNAILSMGNNLALRDLYVEYELIKDSIAGNNVEEYMYLCFEVKGECPILCSSIVNPICDINGKIIQNYNDENIFTRSFSFNIIAENDKYYIIFSWFSCKEINSFFNSVHEKYKDNILQILIEFAFAYSENSAINIKWFDELSLIKKERLKKIFWLELINNDSGVKTVKEFRNLEFVKHSITRIIKNAPYFV